jgi:hypothetical protein
MSAVPSVMKEQFSLKKPDVEMHELPYLQPELWIIIGAFLVYARNHNLPVVFTSAFEKAAGRISKTHEEGRAIDVSVGGWTATHIERVCFHINKTYGADFGTSPSGMDLKVIVFHKVEGSKEHFHIQVRRA